MEMNPCVEARYAKQLPVVQFASLLQVSRQFVENAEYGCYAKIPPAYHYYLLDPLAEAHKKYRAFQTETRRANFSPEDFPENPKSVAEIIKHLGIPPTRFARLMCVQQAHVHRLLTNKRTFIPQPLIQAFLEIGLPTDYLISLSDHHVVITPQKKVI